MNYDLELKCSVLSKRLDQIEKEIKSLQSLLQNEETAKCQHVAICSNCKKEKCKCKGEWGSGFAKCKKCKDDLGWYCKSSPDHRCYYFTEVEDETGRLYVELLDGSRSYMKKDHEQEYETDDCCLFCTLPDERK